MIDPLAASQATPVSALSHAIKDTTLLAVALATVAIAALVAMCVRNLCAMLLLIPQQVVLTISATGAIAAIYLGQYADGVLRQSAFIAADQLLPIYVAIGHTVSMILQARRHS